MKINRDETIKATIIDAANRVFQKWGLNKTTMEDIAKAAGKGKSTLYYYYTSKEEIFYTVMSQSIGKIIDASRSKMADEKTASGKLRAYIVTLTEEVRKIASLYDIVRGEISEKPKLINQIRSEFDTQEIDLISALVESGIQSGEFRKYSGSEIASIAYVITCATRGLLRDLYIDNAVSYDSERIHILIDLFFHGIKR
jgi:AcrR family transcriptional regulator